ncbi:Ribonuclease H-like domain containing protein [Trema orientale]|uniref:Ribonuclease H-like domain containing protein n=1 Tax=Trema orientale TaxID=63057 RepID=A0A2P5CHU9_TREOI|nr:Ribonuclease H-like domain containing protein [Trema orientale]
MASSRTCLLKLNVDASVNSSEGTIGVGAMAKKLEGCFDSYIAECLAIHEGLAFAKDNLLCVDRVESNSLRVVTALGCHEEETLILDDVRYLLSEASNGSYCFIPRNGNKAPESSFLQIQFQQACVIYM